MRLWSIHPSYLDSIGLVALWREALLAKKVLEGRTRGYKFHPQLIRFEKYSEPLKAISAYLTYVYFEAQRRGYSFDRNKIDIIELKNIIPVTKGQLQFETKHLREKIKKRRGPFSSFTKKIFTGSKILPHPIFKIVDGGVEEWERGEKK
ncbi:MAG: pyrimidine dimer DNA glycosylase/endonuclease V [Chitinispirillaceae bacterium]|nr:pyrimidine dimer DNA glycosylase/endonuclease V [Chitinispirillaceae bacterium]